MWFTLQHVRMQEEKNVSMWHDDSYIAEILQGSKRILNSLSLSKKQKNQKERQQEGYGKPRDLSMDLN